MFHELAQSIELNDGPSVRAADANPLVTLGAWFIAKWRARLVDTDAYTVALQMRKQGIPIDVARLALLGRHSEKNRA